MGNQNFWSEVRTKFVNVCNMKFVRRKGFCLWGVTVKCGGAGIACRAATDALQ
jgi:hypothetical protein